MVDDSLELPRRDISGPYIVGTRWWPNLVERKDVIPVVVVLRRVSRTVVGDFNEHVWGACFASFRSLCYN